MFETMCVFPALYTVYNAAPTLLVSDALSTTQSQTVDSTLLALATTKKGISIIMHGVILLYDNTTFTEIEKNIEELKEMFSKLKKKAIESLKASSTEVNEVVYELSDLSPKEKTQHKAYLTENQQTLSDQKDHIALFTSLNLQWDYLSPQLFSHLVNKLNCLKELKEEMNNYNKTLKTFRVTTPLKLFCEIHRKHFEPTDEFCKIVKKYKSEISKDMTLQDVEDFRQKYADHYQLYEFALQLYSIVPGSFIVTFLVPESVVDILKENIPENLLKLFGIARLEIAGCCVYSDSTKTVASSIAVPHSTSPIAIPISSLATVLSSRRPILLSGSRERQSVLQSMSMAIPGIHRSMSLPELHQHPKPEELFLTQQLQQKV